jgi:hypothetical protein
MKFDPQKSSVVVWQEKTGVGSPIKQPERKFPTLAAAIRFVIEELDPAFRRSASIVTADGPLTISQIMYFYHCLRADV